MLNPIIPDEAYFPTHVDTGGDTSSGKRQNLERGEVGLAEDVDLEVLTPRQDLDQLWGIVHKLLVLRAKRLVDDRGETCLRVS